MARKSLIILLLLCFSCEVLSSNSETWIKSGYWYAGTNLSISDIDSTLFTHLSCAFAYLNASSYEVSINSSHQLSFTSFTNIVRRKNPSIFTLLSIWVGRQYSPIFSSMINQSSSRKSFIESSISTARLYGFQGLDLGGVKHDNITSMTNLGVLLSEWRYAIASEGRKSGNQELILAMAVYNLQENDSVSYPTESMRRNLDWVRVAAYDYYVPTEEKYTGLNAALYGPSGRLNANESIMSWISGGMPANKLLLGLPYHGYAWLLLNALDNDIGEPASGPTITPDGSMGYKLIKSYMRTYGFGAASVYNSTYAVNLFQTGMYWINFDDVEAITAKISYAKKMGMLGYAAFQLSNDDNWVLSKTAANAGDEDQQNHVNVRLLVIVLVTIVGLALVVTMVCYCLQSRVLKLNGIMDTLKLLVSKLVAKVSNAPDRNSSSPQAFSFATIKVATNNFSDENKLGEGGFGPVYKGKLPSGEEIAVKRLSRTSNQGMEELKNEVALTATLQHVNLVSVVGFCTETEEKMLVYKYMPNKSLDQYLFDPIGQNLLDWRKRVNIIEGVTQALLYLQEYANVTIIHRDIKASNILLDDEMNPKISDFGMARIFRKDELEANTGRIVGTYGYVPPEYVRKGIYSTKYDVYSFGVLLLQIISGKRTRGLYGPHENMNLLQYAYELWKDGAGMEFIDATLDDSSSTCKIIRCMHIALLCVQENAVDRPSMLEVFSMLKNEAVPITTPKHPAFSINSDEKNHEECLKLCRERTLTVDDASITKVVPR